MNVGKMLTQMMNYKLFYLLVLVNILLFLFISVISCGGTIFVPGQDEEQVEDPPIICCLDNEPSDEEPVDEEVPPEEEEEVVTPPQGEEDPEEEEENPEDPPTEEEPPCDKLGYYVCHVAGPNHLTLKLGSANAIWAHLKNHDDDYLGQCIQ